METMQEQGFLSTFERKKSPPENEALRDSIRCMGDLIWSTNSQYS
jgi:hypothetical protein